MLHSDTKPDRPHLCPPTFSCTIEFSKKWQSELFCPKVTWQHIKLQADSIYQKPRYTHVRTAKRLSLALVLVPELPVLTNSLGPLNSKSLPGQCRNNHTGSTLGANFDPVLTTSSGRACMVSVVPDFVVDIETNPISIMPHYRFDRWSSTGCRQCTSTASVLPQYWQSGLEWGFITNFDLQLINTQLTINLITKCIIDNNNLKKNKKISIVFTRSYFARDWTWTWDLRVSYLPIYLTRLNDLRYRLLMYSQDFISYIWGALSIDYYSTLFFCM